MRKALTGFLIIFGLSASWGFSQWETTRGSDIHFRGPVSGIERDQDDQVRNLTIQVNRSQITVQLSSWTRISQGSGFQVSADEIRLGDFLELSGFFTLSGRIVAESIHIESSDDISVEGVVSQMTGNTLQVNGIDFQLDDTTELHAAGSETSATLGNLKAGMVVRLRGNMEGGFLVVRELEYGERTVESEPIRFEGRVTEIEGQLLSVDVGVHVADALVALDENTLVTGQFRVGSMIGVEGRFVPGTSLVKGTRIAVDTNKNGNLYDEGPGGTPAVTKVVLEGDIKSVTRNSFREITHISVEANTIELDAETDIRFKDGEPGKRRDLRIGDEVVVRGTRFADSVVLAEQIEIQKDKPHSEGGDPVFITGKIDGLKRGAQNLVTTHIVVKGNEIRVDANTVISRGENANLSNSDLQIGQEVEVDAVLVENGSLLAEWIRIMD